MSTQQVAVPAIDQLCINTIRTLSMDAVQQAKSGHPGTPMALAPLVYTIWNRVMRFDPAGPDLAQPRPLRALERSRLDAALVGAPPHRDAGGERRLRELGQPSVTLDDIRRFRQLDSKAPGHPEYHWVSGVETTTGPLGQGVATSVGMAIAQKWLASRYNRPGFDIFDYNIYAVCGDGCLMEGVASEAASLAGHLGLDNLCWVYDNNHITIEGNTRIAFTEDVAARFLGLRLERAARRRRQRHRSHRARARDFPEDEGPPHLHHSGQPHRLRLPAQAGHRRSARRAARRGGDPPLPSAATAGPRTRKFLVPEGVYEHFAAGIGARGAEARAGWIEALRRLSRKYPELAAEIDQMQRRELPAGWDRNLPVFPGRPQRALPGAMPRARC